MNGECVLYSFHPSRCNISAVYAAADPAATAAAVTHSAHARHQCCERRRWKIEDKTVAEGAHKVVVKTFDFTTPGQYKAGNVAVSTVSI